MRLEEVSDRELDARVAERIMGLAVEWKPAHKKWVDREELVRHANGVAKTPLRYKKWRELVDVPMEPWLTNPYKMSHGLPLFTQSLNHAYEALRKSGLNWEVSGDKTGHMVRIWADTNRDVLGCGRIEVEEGEPGAEARTIVIALLKATKEEHPA